MTPPPTSTIDDDRLSLEDAADRLFYQHGVAGVTVAAIRDGSGVSLRRIYEICPAKSDLVSLWLRHRHARWMADFSNRVNSGIETGTAPIDAVFDTIENWMIETDFRGCGFINTHAEQTELTDEHVQIIQDHKTGLAAYLDELVGHGPALGVLLDGAIVQASIFSTVEPIHLARNSAHVLLATSRETATNQ